jgi:hypothetical protein
MSVAEPAVKGTMIFTGFVGYVWADAVPARASRQASSVRIAIMVSPR